MDVNYNINSILNGCMCAQLYPTLCNSMDYNPSGSSVHGIFQARILEWVAISYYRDLPNPGIKRMCPALAVGFFTTKHL